MLMKVAALEQRGSSELAAQISHKMAALARLSIAPSIATALGSESRILICTIDDEVSWETKWTTEA